MKNSNSVFPVLFLFVLLTSSCSDPSSNEKEKTAESLTGITWQLSHISEAGLVVGVPYSDSLYTIFFNEENGLDIKDHCNTCNVSYALDGESISFGNFACTLATCSSTKLNTTLSSELGNIRSFRIIDDELQLSTDDGWIKRVLHFRNAKNTAPKKVLLTDLDTFDRESWDDGAYQVEMMSIEEDIVTLKVSYSGCGVKDLNMVFYNYFLESEPVQSYAFLPQINEACLAFFSDEYSFDLAPLKDSFLEAYPGSGGSINISIRENGETLEQFTYGF